MRSGDKEPPPHPSSCDGVRRGAGADPGADGRGGCPQHGGLCAEDGPERLCAPCGPGSGTGAGVPPASVLQQLKPGGDPGQHLRGHLPPGHRHVAKGLCRAVGTLVRVAETIIESD